MGQSASNGRGREGNRTGGTEGGEERTVAGVG